MSKGVSLGFFLSILILFGCGGGGAVFVAPPAAGTAAFESAGGAIRMRGHLSFVDGAGASVAGPSEGALVLVGTETKAGGTDAGGVFTIENLPSGSDLRIRVFARGFNPIDFVVPSGTASTSQMRCQVDTNPNDNPQLTNEQFVVADDGVARYLAQSEVGSTMHVVSSPTLTPKVYSGASGDTLPIASQQQGNQIQYTADIGPIIPTGTLFVLLSAPGGTTTKTYGTCQLKLSGYSRAGKVVSGLITGPGGGVCAGAEILVWEEGNSTNRGSGTTGANGRFGVGMISTPVNNVSVSVQWTDPATAIIYVCLFTGNP